MIMIRTPFLFATTVVLFLLRPKFSCFGKITTDTCGENIPIEESDAMNCSDTLFSLKLHLPPQSIGRECLSLSIFKLDGVVDCQWAENFMPCLEESPKLSGLISTGSGGTFVHLYSVTCVQYTLSEASSCSCKMDCLFSFQEQSQEIDVYAYLEAISCDAAQVNQVIAFLRRPNTSITYVNASVPYVPCNVTDECPMQTPMASISPPSPSLSPSPSLAYMSTLAASKSESPTPPSTPVTDTCGDNVLFEESDVFNCSTKLNSLNPQLLHRPLRQDCFVLSVFNLSGVSACHWVESFLPCLRIHPTTLSQGLYAASGYPFIALHSVTCMQHVLGENFQCSCQMDCLFSFKETSTGSDIIAYAYLVAISCDTSKVDEVKAFLNNPKIIVSYVNGSTPSVPCNLTEDCSPPTSKEAGSLSSPPLSLSWTSGMASSTLTATGTVLPITEEAYLLPGLAGGGTVLVVLILMTTLLSVLCLLCQRKKSVCSNIDSYPPQSPRLKYVIYDYSGELEDSMPGIDLQQRSSCSEHFNATMDDTQRPKPLKHSLAYQRSNDFSASALMSVKHAAPSETQCARDPQ